MTLLVNHVATNIGTFLSRLILEIKSVSPPRETHFFLLAVLGIITSLLLLVSVSEDPTRLYGLSPEHLQRSGGLDSTPKRTALVGFLLVIAAGAFFLRKSDVASFLAVDAVFRWLWGYVVLFAGLSTIVDFAWRYAATEEARTLAVTATILILFCILVSIQNWEMWKTASLIIGSLVLLSAFPAICSMHFLLPAEWIWGVDHHYAAMFGQADLLSAGFLYFRDSSFNYGIFVPMVLSAITRFGYKYTFGDLQFVVALFQPICLGLFVLAVFLRTRRAESGVRVFSALIVAMVAFPYLNMANAAIALPTQSGFRYLTFPIAIFVSMLFGTLKPFQSAVIFGSFSAFAMIYNLETGIVVIAALSLSWLVFALKKRKAGAIAWSGAIGFAVGVVAVFCVVQICYYKLFGSWIAIPSMDRLPLLQSFGTGFGGGPLRFHVVELVIVVHSAYIVSQGLSCLLGRERGNLDSSGLAIAAVLIAWFPYYINKPNEWNLWTYLVLYAVLVAPRISEMPSRVLRAAIAVGFLMLMPVAFIWSSKMLFSNLSSQPQGYIAFSGLYVDAATASDLGSRIKELEAPFARGKIFWLSAYSLLILRSSEKRPGVAVADPYLESITLAGANGIAAKITAYKPNLLLLDGRGGAKVDEAVPEDFRTLYARIAGIAGYEPCPLVEFKHWQAWVPQGTCVER